jgi:hypothetical protein
VALTSEGTATNGRAGRSVRDADTRSNPQITSLELDQGRGTRSGARFALHERFAAFAILIARLGKGVSLEPRPLDPKIAELATRLFDLP